MISRQISYQISYQGRFQTISAQIRRGGDDLVLLLHGLGCSREIYDAAFEAEALRTYSLCALDFPSHGRSSPLAAPLTNLEAYAGIVRVLLDQVERRRTIVVGHSLGGAVGLIAARDLPDLAGFISVEGNLAPEDCGVASRHTAAQSSDDFARTGHRQFLDRLRASRDPATAAWSRWWARCDPAGLHGIARSLVDWTDSGRLFTLFTEVANPHYVYGAESSLDHLLPRLHGLLPHHPVPGAGHFVMLDNPSGFYTRLGQIFSHL